MRRGGSCGVSRRPAAWQETVFFLVNNAAAGAFIEASSRAAVRLGLIESFRGGIAQPSASCWVERVLWKASSADAPSMNKPLFQVPKVTGDLAPSYMALKSRCILSEYEKSLESFLRMSRRFLLFVRMAAD